MKGAESWQEAKRYLERFQTGSSVEKTTDDNKKRKRKRILNSKHRPQASSDEEESTLPDALAVLSFEKSVPGNKFSVLPDTPEVSFGLENQENVEPSVDFRAAQCFLSTSKSQEFEYKRKSTLSNGPLDSLEITCTASFQHRRGHTEESGNPGCH